MMKRVAKLWVFAAWAIIAAQAGAATYIEMPIVGQIGTDVTPDTVRDVLQHAVDHGAEHVVLRIDTGGGFVPPAEQIWNTLGEFEDRLTYHAVIDKCVSAGIWMAYACDTLHMTPDAIWGAAAVHDTLADNTTRNNEKSSAIYAAQIAAGAQRRGHSAVVVRGMVVTGTEVWSWRDAQGQPRLTAYRPDPGTHDQLVRLDGDASLLTLTTPEAVQAGIAASFDGDAAALAEPLGIASWHRLDGYGIARSVHARYRHNLDEFVTFNANLRNDPNLLSWRDFRYDGLIPSLYGQPQPGLENDAAEQALASFIERLETAYATALAAEPELMPAADLTPQAWQDRCDTAREAWQHLDRVVGEIEQRYAELTGIQAEIKSLKAWPLVELDASWSQRTFSID